MVEVLQHYLLYSRYFSLFVSNYGFLLSDDKVLFQAFNSAGSKVYTPETMPKEMLDPIEKFVLTVCVRGNALA